MNKIVLHATALDGFLTEQDKINLDNVYSLYDKSLEACSKIEKGENAEADLIQSAREIGDALEKISNENGRIHVYCFETPDEQHGEASRIIAKLRDPETGHEEFLYYIQRAYELMFAHAFADIKKKRSLVQITPVTNPCRNYAVHRIPDIDERLIHL